MIKTRSPGPDVDTRTVSLRCVRCGDAGITRKRVFPRQRRYVRLRDSLTGTCGDACDPDRSRDNIGTQGNLSSVANTHGPRACEPFGSEAGAWRTQWREARMAYSGSRFRGTHNFSIFGRHVRRVHLLGGGKLLETMHVGRFTMTPIIRQRSDTIGAHRKTSVVAVVTVVATIIHVIVMVSIRTLSASVSMRQHDFSHALPRAAFMGMSRRRR